MIQRGFVRFYKGCLDGCMRRGPVPPRADVACLDTWTVCGAWLSACKSGLRVWLSSYVQLDRFLGPRWACAAARTC